MKTLLLIVLIALLGTFSMKGQDTNPDYDPALAKKLGADDFGMKSYVLVILKSGKNVVQEKPERDNLFAGHFENIRRLADQGKLIVAGPVEKNDNSYRGIFILDVTTFDEANGLLEADPTIRANIFDVELYKLYGSAALPVYYETHKKIEKRQFK